MSELGAVLGDVDRDMTELGLDYALIGGLAVSVRTAPRFTRDIDVVVVASDDAAAQAVAAGLVGRGWRIESTLEQEAVDRLAAIRLARPRRHLDPILDVLFASSGIEGDVARGATPLEVLEGVVVPVAQPGHLIALKLLSAAPSRRQDEIDLDALLGAADDVQLALAESACHAIVDRGYARGRDLPALLRGRVGGASGE